MRLSIRLLVGVSASMTLLLLAVAARGDKFPEPSPYPISWQLKLTHGAPKRVVVKVPGDPHPAAYWYMTYTISNPGDKAEDFVPQFSMLSEDGQLTRSDLAIAPEVFNEIKRREGIKALLPARLIEGPLNPGDDEAKDGVAIWREPMLRMGSFSIFVAGLSGEFAEIKDKEGKPTINKDSKTGEEIRVVVRKALQLQFHVVGDEVRPGEDESHPSGERWIMR